MLNNSDSKIMLTIILSMSYNNYTVRMYVFVKWSRRLLLRHIQAACRGATLKQCLSIMEE